jgi:sporulation protein YlmC with PRC-barrel domain
MSELNTPATRFLDHRVIHEEGEPIGTIVDVLFDPEGAPRWAVVKPGMLRRAHYMPLDQAYTSEDGDVVVPYRKETVTHAPVATADHIVTEDLEREIAVHYG